MRAWRRFLGFPLAVRLLLVNQFGINTGFYLLVPYLAGYLSHDLGMSARSWVWFSGCATSASKGCSCSAVRPRTGSVPGA